MRGALSPSFCLAESVVLAGFLDHCLYVCLSLLYTHMCVHAQTHTCL